MRIKRLQIPKPRHPKRPKATALRFIMCALLISIGLLYCLVDAQQQKQQRPREDSNLNPCRGKAEGAPCPLDLSGTSPIGPCRVGRCRGSAGNRVCANERASTGTLCPDTDGNSCTVARCSAAGACDTEQDRGLLECQRRRSDGRPVGEHRQRVRAVVRQDQVEQAVAVEIDVDDGCGAGHARGEGLRRVVPL